MVWHYTILMVHARKDEKQDVNVGLRLCTRELVADQFAAVDVADARKQRSDVILRHRLRQVVDNQVRDGHSVDELVIDGVSAVVQLRLLASVLRDLLHCRGTPSTSRHSINTFWHFIT